jgi:hypothetical protein
MNPTERELSSLEIYRGRGPVAWVEIRNSGQTPAYDVSVEVWLAMGLYPGFGNLPELPIDQYGYQTIIPPQGHIEHFCRIEDPLRPGDLTALRSGNFAIDVWGR